MTNTIAEYRMDISVLKRVGPLIEASISGPTDLMPALIDTGARRSLIDTDAARAVELETVGTEIVVGVTGAKLYPTFQCDMRIPLLGAAVPMPIRSADLVRNGSIFASVIGRDVLENYRLTVDWQTGEIRFQQMAGRH